MTSFPIRLAGAFAIGALVSMWAHIAVWAWEQACRGWGIG